MNIDPAAPAPDHPTPPPSTALPLTPEPPPTAEELTTLTSTMSQLTAAISLAIQGKPEAITMALVCVLAGGHLLVEDVPGVGKTMLAKALAKAVGCPMRRIQFTPDLLPSDITGISIFNQETRGFEFRPGAIFANVVVCDEINRASPKTQSAVLESMEECQVTVDAHTYSLPQPFFVVATQNPLEMEGTYPLPEAQRDRFMARISMGYPDPDAEITMLGSHGPTPALPSVPVVTDVGTINSLATIVRRIHTSAALKSYVVKLVGATRTHSGLRLGASPRASLHLLRAAQAWAALQGRAHVLPDDVRAMWVPLIEHRVLLSADGLVARRAVRDILAEILAEVAPSQKAS